MEARSRWLGARAAVLSTLAVGALSVLTGTANVTLGGTALLPFVTPEIRDLFAFTVSLSGFLLLSTAFGLRRRFRAAWVAATVLVLAAALQGLVQLSTAPLSAPLVGLSTFALVALVRSRRRFDRRLELDHTQVAAVTALVGTLVYGTVGTFFLNEQFVGVDSPVDAFYFTVVTGTTVGYGDVNAQTDVARLFTLSLVVVSVASFALALGALLTPAIEARFERAFGHMTKRDLEPLEDHVLVLGYGELTEPILDELDDVPVLVVTPDADRARALDDREFDVLTGDPTDSETLLDAGIDAARAVVAATDSDAADALAVLTARGAAPDVRIVAAASDGDNVQKLREAGADAVISPTLLGAHLLALSALDGADTERLADQVLDETGAGDER